MSTTICHREPKKIFRLNGLYLVWLISEPKNIFLLTLIVNKWLWLTALKEFFFSPMSATKIRNIYIFLAYLVCVIKGDKWVKFGRQSMKL